LRKKIVVLFTLLFIISTSSFLEASDIKPFEISARVASLGGAFAARTDDSSLIFYNPAALGFSLGIMVKVNLFYPKMTMKAEYPGIPTAFQSDVNKIRGSTFISWNIKERIGFGFGVFPSHAMETRWHFSWTGHDISIRSKWSTIYIRPVVAVKISKHFSVGAGIDFISSEINWNYDRIFTFRETGYEDDLVANSDSNLNAKGIGYVVSALIRISDSIRLGVRYQPKVKLDFEGEHHFVFEQSLDHPGYLQDTTSTLTIPQEFVIGGLYSFGSNLTFQVDYKRIWMSEIKQWEFDLSPEFKDVINDYVGARPDDFRQGVDLHMKDISRIMFGVEYCFKNSIAIRAGYTYQISAFEKQMIHPVFPDLDTKILSFGIGYDGPTFSVWDPYEKLGGISLDAFFQYGFSQKSTSALPEFPASYQANRWIVGIGIGITY
jgi:long-subunit fatty acid transport protein